ncbi:MAG: polyprenyl synthetase family protein [Bacteroidetes bacterium]|nr:polyprenyl synthetase family protein [Bacteroidota bacterium]MBU1113871.1 polyprenyl synthetase family protein [Bacteroidota bacterium]MBU1798103.1 polyprenyl synthetase family protein [Bacteroidota bacterium]
MNKINLNELQNPVKHELVEFSSFFKQRLVSDKKILDYALRFILSQKGKRIRPLLVLLSAKISGKISERSFRGASLVELLHTATLVHDDVVDEAEKRRGFPSLNKIWGNKISVLVGDFLLSKGLMIAVENNDFDFLKTITNTVKRMSEGELLQIYKAKKLDINEETYFKIISDKTASLFSTCCEIGALSATENSEKIEALKNYGEYLGIAFQIKDDILDFIGKTKVFGKVQGGDIKEKKLTLPLIYALENCDVSKRNKMIKLIRKGKNDFVGEIISFVKESNGIVYSQNIAEEYSAKAKKCLDVFEDSDSKTSLIKLVNYVIKRDK